jgi:pimeloyl-ACP methyl ester carboxylesterase
VFLVGHSLGGFLSLMCAALPSGARARRGADRLAHPRRLARQHAELVKRTPLMKSVSPGAISRKRRNSWEHREAVFEHFRSKKAFREVGRAGAARLHRPRHLRRRRRRPRR